jgi:hypothetical protein
MSDERGHPIAYMVLAEGTPVQAGDGAEVGTVKRVLADAGADIFDGLSLDTADGERFVDATQVDSLYERLVVLSISGEEASRLPEHSPGPAVLEATADDVAGDTTGAKVRDAAQRTWDRLSGKG